MKYLTLAAIAALTACSAPAAQSFAPAITPNPGKPAAASQAAPAGFVACVNQQVSISAHTLERNVFFLAPTRGYGFRRIWVLNHFRHSSVTLTVANHRTESITVAAGKSRTARVPSSANYLQITIDGRHDTGTAAITANDCRG